MDLLETLAISEPLCARILALNAINKDDPTRDAKYAALRLTIPPVRVFSFGLVFICLDCET